MKMTPAEAINATTVNGAAAIEVSSALGSITASKSASLIISKPGSVIESLPYHFGHSLVDKILTNGQMFSGV